jgi:hypothetical protein
MLTILQDQYDTIDFSDNEIEKLENFPLLPRLQSIYLNNNHISKITPGISDSLPKLDTLILTNNRLVNLHDIDPLAEISTLRTLSLIDNVIQKKPHYRLYVIHKLPLLRLLDFKKIKAKVCSSLTLFSVTPLSLHIHVHINPKINPSLCLFRESSHFFFFSHSFSRSLYLFLLLHFISRRSTSHHLYQPHTLHTSYPRSTALLSFFLFLLTILRVQYCVSLNFLPTTLTRSLSSILCANVFL